ncbi:MAG TPA: hypothetical protein VMI11_09720 [Actinomycetes bacterium]|nr:hypothetical protein [Actinomycetes bacterium]
MTALTTTAPGRTSRWTPGTVAATSLVFGGACMVIINLSMNRPNHDDIASTDLYVGAFIVGMAAIVYAVARAVWGNPDRCAKAGLALGILLVLATPVWFSLSQPVLGIGAIALALRARDAHVRPRMTMSALVLGGLGLLVGVVFSLASVIHYFVS